MCGRHDQHRDRDRGQRDRGPQLPVARRLPSHAFASPNEVVARTALPPPDLTVARMSLQCAQRRIQSTRFVQMHKKRQYVALLRAINVGGRSLIKMADLRALFESLGLASVATYIQTGNVLFRAEETDRARLARTI